MPQLPAIGAEVLETPAASALPPIGGEVPQTATFSSTNEKDETGAAVVNPNTIGTFASKFGAQFNPLPLGQMIPFPQAAGGAGWDAPIQTLKRMGAAQGALFEKAKASYAKGEYVTAARHLADYMLPVIGPILDQSADEMQAGQYAAGLGTALGFGSAAVILPKVLPAALAKAKAVAAGPFARNPNLAENAAVAFGQERGIPVDAGTATGNRFVKGIQGLSDHSPIGSVVAERARGATSEGLQRVGGELAADVHPEAVTPEQAGTVAREGVEGLVRDFHDQATQSYAKLRSFEADPANAAEVPSTRSPRELAAAQREINRRMEASTGGIPTAEELHEVRRIKAELDALPFVKRTWTEAPRKSGNAAGGDYDITPGAAGAAVYDDILQHAPGTSSMTRGEIRQSLDTALETGQFTNAAKGALEVARKRLAGGSGVSKPSLPPSAGNVAAAKTETMLLPVDIRPAKAMLKPLADRLAREKQLTGVLMGDKARASVALDSLISGPDHAPVSIVDAALGDIKAMARGAAMPELRSAGQGAAAEAVKQLDRVVREAVAKAGPEAIQALETGRQATVAKYATADVLDALRAEPVKGYRQLTAPKDTSIALLRQVADSTPAAMPQIGRAVLEELLTKATSEGGFQHAAKIQADWQRLGPQTKQILFGENTTNLDQFFLLAKKLAESPNPSQSGLILNAGAQAALVFTNPATGVPLVLGSGALLKILHSAKAVKLLTHGMRLASGPGRASTVAQGLAIADVITAAREVGVPLALPKAADEAPPDPVPSQSLPVGAGR